MSSQDIGAVASPPAPTAAFVISNLLICSFLWGSSFLLVKLSGNLNPFVLAAMRGLIGAASGKVPSTVSLSSGGPRT